MQIFEVLVEYKMKEPRTHCFVNTAATAILMTQDLDRVGILLDVGHSLAAKENMAEAAALIASHNKLDYIHFNDNYRAWDDDMMLGSVHLVEHLELVYWLKRIDYQGWLTLDIFPYREDGVRAAEHCPVSILQARGGDAIPEVALWAIDRFVAVTVVPAVEPPKRFP